MSESTAQGHMHQEKQNLQSTKQPKIEKTDNPLPSLQSNSVNDDIFPPSPAPNIKTHQVAHSIMNRKELNTAYQDLTGRFPMKSSRGNECILVGYHYDANCILAHPAKNRKGPTLVGAWQHLQNEFAKAGTAPEAWILDNEVSDDLKSAFSDNEVEFQLAPPHSHRRNLAERAMQTFKNHFKAGLASTNPNFPLSEWDRLIPQANITLNLLRTARSNPALSAHAHAHGTFNFNATPLAPPGMKVIAHVAPSARGTMLDQHKTTIDASPAISHAQERLEHVRQ